MNDDAPEGFHSTVMTFLAPWAGWFLAGLPVIVALYLLRLQRRPVTVSTLMFWQRLMQESRRRSLFQRLRNLLSLLLHLLIFLLLVAALAKPTFQGFSPLASSTVLIIDGRARMQTVEEDGISRFERARRAARRYARQASASQQIAVLMAGATDRVVVGFSGDEKPLQKALEGMQPSDAGGSMDHAIDLARQLLEAQGGARRIVVITDRVPAENQSAESASIPPAISASGSDQQADPSSASPQPPAAATLQVVAVGTGRDNVAITRFATRENLASAETCEVLLEVRNFAGSAKQFNVELRLDGALIDVKPFALQSGETKTELFSAVPRPGPQARGWFTAQLDAKDALAVDDTAFAVIPRQEPARVLLVSKGNWFLEKLLASDHQIEFQMVAPEGWQLAMAPNFDAVICDNIVPAGVDLATLKGNYFFVRSAPFRTDGATTEQPLITEVDAQHPALRLVNVQNVAIVRASHLPMPPEENGWKWSAPLRSFDQPLLLAGARRVDGREQRMIVLGFDIAESDLPLRIAFPLMMSNALNWLAHRPAVPHDALNAGEQLSLDAGEQVASDPQPLDAKSSPASATKTPGALFVPKKNGFYSRTTALGEERWIAVNTFDPAESDLRPIAAGDRADAHARFSSWRALGRFGAWPPWQYLTLSALLLFAFEWWLFHRRRTE
ncbi:MAG TPA: BatA and WFA domain-containing protein [Chthoniobacteraceae bacterium]|nr:BatA and WFA domain-containing protein [Chthoniobacteraceae bacterium]